MKISVVIPFYNGYKRNIHTVEMLLKLQYRSKHDFEFIFIDDGSDLIISEKTKQYIKLSKLTNVIFHNNLGNKGVTYSWNTGIQLSKGTYVMIINNDIEINKKVLDRMIKGLKDPDTFLSCPHEIINGQIHHRENNINGACRMIRKKDWQYIGPIDYRLKLFFNDDWIFQKILSTLGRKIDYFDENIIHFCSQTVKDFENLDERTKKDMDVYFKICQENSWYDSRF